MYPLRNKHFVKETKKDKKICVTVLSVENRSGEKKREKKGKNAVVRVYKNRYVW